MDNGKILGSTLGVENTAIFGKGSFRHKLWSWIIHRIKSHIPSFTIP